MESIVQADLASRSFDRRVGWEPEKRPEWLAQFNGLGKLMDIKSVVPLDETSLLTHAMANTGLSDFGDDNWRPHFRMLLKLIEAEAKLNFFGRLWTRSDFLTYLEARLQIVDAYRKHPEIEDEVVKEPIFIVGFGRSGTTILHEVLSNDPQFRSVQRWEELFPAPPPEEATYRTDPRIAKAQGLVDVINAVSPEWKKMHAWGGDIPVEDIEFTYPAFLSEVWPLGFQIPSWEPYFAQQDVGHHFAWHKKTLKYLQWKYKKPHWLMKNPTHLPRLPRLLEFYPDAKFIFTHRDPITSGDSVVNVQGVIFYWRTDEPWSGNTIDEWVLADQRAKMWDDVIDWIETGVIKPGSFANFQYHEFIDAPLTAIEKAYGDLGLAMTDEARERMRAFLAARPQHQHGKHTYKRAGHIDEVASDERRKYRRYQDYFGVPDEM
jgi:hypothetical protein